MKIIYLCIIIAILFAGSYLSYERVEQLNETRCLGCIGMQPKVEKFKEFWIKYPKSFNREGLPLHPSWIVNISKEKVVMLFFWSPACKPCKEQWEEMKKVGLVEGSEENGRIGENFSYVALFSIDITSSEGNIIKIYTPDGNRVTPTTVILFEKNNTIYWYAFTGKADGKGGRPSVEELIKILEKAKEEKYDLQS